MAPINNNKKNKVFVGKLPLNVNQEELKAHFSTAGEISNIKIKKNNRKNLAYAFINFVEEESTQKAITNFDGKQFNESEIEVQEAKPSVARKERKQPKAKANAGRKPVRANKNNGGDNKEISKTSLFVSNLPFNLDDESLGAIFKEFNFSSAHIVSRNGRSKGYGFVDFNNEEDTKAALDAKNKAKVEDREINIRNAYKTDEAAPKTTSFDTIFVSNLSYKLEDNELEENFKNYGIAKAYVARTKKGKSKGFGFVVLSSENQTEEALAAKQTTVITEMTKKQIQGREIFVRAAYHPNEKSEEKEEKEKKVEKQEPKPISLYVSNIPFAVTTEELTNLFNGTKGFVSANVVTAKNGKSRGYGFVTFETDEDRDAALESKKDVAIAERTLSLSVAKGKKPKSNKRRQNGNRKNRKGGRKPRSEKSNE